MTAQSINLEAYLEINDLLGFTGPITIDGFDLDAIVNVVVVQTSSKTLGIDLFEVDGGVVDALEDGPSVVYLNYAAQLGTEVSRTLIKFTNEAERLALEYARNASEDQWQYRIGEV